MSSPILNGNKKHAVKCTTIVLAIAFALQSTLAFAEGPMNLADPAARPAARGGYHSHGKPYRNLASEFLGEKDPGRSTLNAVGHDPRWAPPAFVSTGSAGTGMLGPWRR